MRKAVITIDDSPSPITNEIVTYLKVHNIFCIFFCIGKKMQENESIIDRIINSGCVIGNHSYSHQSFSNLSLSECKKEILKTEEVIEYAYSRNNVQRPMKCFRFPYGDKGGDKRSELQEYLRIMGFNGLDELRITYDWYHDNFLDSDKDVFWTFDCMDYLISVEGSNFNSENVRKHLIDKNPANGGVLVTGISDEIILLHDNEKTAIQYPRYYEDLISRIEQMGLVLKAM